MVSCDLSSPVRDVHSFTSEDQSRGLNRLVRVDGANNRAYLPARSFSHGCLSVIFATPAGLRRCVCLIFPLAPFGPQLQEQTFGRREQFFKSLIGLYAIVCPVEDRDLQTD